MPGSGQSRASNSCSRECKLGQAVHHIADGVVQPHVSFELMAMPRFLRLCSGCWTGLDTLDAAPPICEHQRLVRTIGPLNDAEAVVGTGPVPGSEIVTTQSVGSFALGRFLSVPREFEVGTAPGHERACKSSAVGMVRTGWGINKYSKKYQKQIKPRDQKSKLP